MIACEYCIHSDLADWGVGAKTGFATAIYYCNKHSRICKGFCDDFYSYADLEKVNSCSECEFFSDSQFYADNSILVSLGSCMKCQRNMTTTNPYQETPSWCPLKGDEDESIK